MKSLHLTGDILVGFKVLIDLLLVDLPLENFQRFFTQNGRFRSVHNEL